MATGMFLEQILRQCSSCPSQGDINLADATFAWVLPSPVESSFAQTEDGLKNTQILILKVRLHNFQVTKL